jgi:cellobiose phosphorylase
LRLSDKSLSWQWQVEVANTTSDIVEMDLVCLQDIGLKAISTGPVNEYYVSQYLERRVLHDPGCGAVVCCRQNMKEVTGHPWIMIACANSAVAGSTDGMQFYGRSSRETGIPEGLLSDFLGGDYAGESSVVALQEKPVSLDPGSLSRSSFVATFQQDHSQATSIADLDHLAELFDEFPDVPLSASGLQLITPPVSLFSSAAFFKASDLDDNDLGQFFGNERRQSEYVNGQLLSFFYGKSTYVMLRAKEILADRPHANIMQTGSGYVPDEGIMSTTAFAFGVFNSHLSQGNTNFSVLLSICTTQFNTTPVSGQRIFVGINGRFFLLGVPSAFESGLNFCRWIYKHPTGCFQVRTWTSQVSPQVNLDFNVIEGPEVSLLITHDFDPLNGWRIESGIRSGEFVALPAPGSMVSEKFPAARFRIRVNGRQDDYRAKGEEVLYNGPHSPAGSLFVLDVDRTSHFCMSFIGEVVSSVDSAGIGDPDTQWAEDMAGAWSRWEGLSLGLTLQGGADIEAIREILPWYGMDALIHFLTPYGLEQFGGAAWGTRDVSQGPVDLLLTMQKYGEARHVLLTLFSNQNMDGGWPQWWMFDSFREIRAGDSHGDVWYWVILALASYIRVTGDTGILTEKLPYFTGAGVEPVEESSVSEHLNRLIGRITDSFIPGTALVPFGGGDWNDSLQPVSKMLAERLISSWTVEMNYEAFHAYQEICELIGDEAGADSLQTLCERIKSDFNRYLILDGVVAGYGLVDKDGSIGVMLHPSDTETGVRYSLLPMERGVLSGIFTKEQAEQHQELIERHLKGPDGARLMDRPLKYRGGIQKLFQRAESSTFFGREIGLMYVHEHIRYAESLARTGKADAFLRALRQAIPVGYREIVPTGDIRQTNCYYSSSDVVFETRYEADEFYHSILRGEITVRGGWRVYSSGPGIFVSLIVTRLLGLRVEFGNLIIDPVIPESLDGLSAFLHFHGYPVIFRYRVIRNSFGPYEISINGKPIRFALKEDKYRNGGALIPLKSFCGKLNSDSNLVEICL